MNQWFEGSKDGLKKIIKRRGSQFVVAELLQNAWDEMPTHVEVTLEPVPGKPLAQITVTDDSPDGFKDLAHAWTLFAPSEKVSDPNKRGRFNLGEKLVLALATEAEIVSTKGGVSFNKDGTRKLTRRSTEKGTVFTATLELTRDEIGEIDSLVYKLIPPLTTKTVYNGHVLESRKPLKTFEATLPTEVADEEGALRRTERKCIVRLFEPFTDESPAIYELGIPVVETEDRYIVDVSQKVPLNFERDNVTPAYLRKLRTLVLNHMSHDLSEEDSMKTWVTDALGHKDIEPIAIKDVLDKRFGEKRVIFDPSDHESNGLAMSKGYTVIPGRALPRDAWENIRQSEAALPAGKVTPSVKILTSSDGVPPIPRTEWTPGYERIADYAKRMAQYTINSSIIVQFMPRSFTPPARVAATFGGSTLTFYPRVLGQTWFDEPDALEVTRLIIHEFGHYFSGDHLSEKYHEGLCKIGARAKIFAKEIGNL